MDKQQASELFHRMHPGFFEREYIKSLPEDEIYEEMLLPLDGFDGAGYDKAFDGSVSFGFFEGDREELLRAVGEVEDGWVKYYTEGSRAYCGYIDGRVASFCLVEDMGRHEVAGRVLRIGGPGCVGTLPCFRHRGIGLVTVKRATQILKDEGFDLSYIHYTAVAPWYARLGYETLLRWSGRGIL